MSDPLGESVEQPIAPVATFYASGETKSSITLAWTTEVGQSVDKFIVKISTDGTNYPSAGFVDVASAQRTYTYVGLSQGTMYYFQILVVEGGRESIPKTINHQTEEVTVPPPGGGEGDGRGVLLDLGKSSVDRDPGQRSYMNNYKTFAQDPANASSAYSHAIREAEGYHEYIDPNPISGFEPTVYYRATTFNGFFDFFFNVNDARDDGSANGFLTIRYKDDCLHVDDQNPAEGIKIWSPGWMDNNKPAYTIGYITPTFDHKWKIIQFPVKFDDLTITNGRYRIMFAEGYSRQICGNLGIDMIKLSPTNNYDEFSPAFDGYWPQIAPANDRHKDLGRTNEWVPGEGGFFPFGGYLDLSETRGADITPSDYVKRSIYPDDDYRVWEDCYINAVIDHNYWDTVDWLFAKIEYEISPELNDFETGFEAKTNALYLHGIKNCFNPVSGMRRYWMATVNDEGDSGKGGTMGTIDYERARTLASSLINSPKIWAWNPIDEFDHEDVGYTKPGVFDAMMNKLYKDIDPNTPVITSTMGYHGTVVSPAFAGHIADGMGNDTYFADSGGSAESMLMQTSRISAFIDEWGRDKAAFAIPYFTVTNTQDTHIVFGESRALTLEEVIWQVWSCICVGAQGIQFFRLLSKQKSNNTPGNPWYKFDGAYDGLKESGRRLFDPTEGVAKCLVAPWVDVDMTRCYWSSYDKPYTRWSAYEVSSRHGVVTQDNQRVFFILKEYQGNRVLFAQNMEEETRSCTFTIPGMSNGNKIVQFESRTVSASGGSFTDSFGRLESHTYIIEGSI